ncbi:MAG: acylphosphatase [Thermanaerothrix sp.]|jgi:acylphosphatase|uniref:Acylphosphatase n=1 Tax=Thermanaerothrix solaris TaxID=3058434 RepID=A0ABU3NQ08_9CHLR|nr:acylphosphatase [Thermanaerothrix sp. 4228-RoL]MDT8897906.1 acylphosphatase [Thermanaerothrix sp. 4228-RoL]
MTMETMRLHARIQGHVQGVGFRYFVQDRALALGLVGWVRNTFDGDVEVVAEGPRDKLETLLDYLRRGPRSAVVTQVDVEWSAASGEFRRFEIRPTA